MKDTIYVNGTAWTSRRGLHEFAKGHCLPGGIYIVTEMMYPRVGWQALHAPIRCESKDATLAWLGQQNPR